MSWIKLLWLWINHDVCLMVFIIKYKHILGGRETIYINMHVLSLQYDSSLSLYSQWWLSLTGLSTLSYDYRPTPSNQSMRSILKSSLSKESVNQCNVVTESEVVKWQYCEVWLEIMISLSLSFSLQKSVPNENLYVIMLGFHIRISLDIPLSE